MSHCHSGLLLAGLGFSCVLGPKANSNPNPNTLTVKMMFINHNMLICKGFNIKSMFNHHQK